MPMVFLSHSSSDKSLAKRIAVDLQMSGIQVWFDEWNIQVGHSISQRIEKGLDDADFVVVVLTTRSVSSGWVQKEWRSKIGDEAASQNIHILPVLAEDCELPRLLQDKKYADLRSDYNRGLGELISAIRVHATKDRPVMAGARIESGRIVYERSNPDVPILRGLINTIEAGCFERHETGLRAHIKVVSSHQAMQDMIEEMGMDRIMLESSEYSISPDVRSPSVFASSVEWMLPAGKAVVDISTGKSVKLPMSLSGRADTYVAGFVEDGIISGHFEQATEFRTSMPLRFSAIVVTGTFRAVVAL